VRDSSAIAVENSKDAATVRFREQLKRKPTGIYVAPTIDVSTMTTSCEGESAELEKDSAA
jgi:hypothetical protein